MDDRRTSTASDELERQVQEAEQAQADADAAVQRAATERAEAEATQQRVLEEHAARREEWAQNVLDTYDADLAAAEAAIRENSDRFADPEVHDRGQPNDTGSLHWHASCSTATRPP